MSEQNPFVGPRPLQQGEPLYGRSVEVRELFNRLQARRIVVLHAPSGAGKSSLVHAGLIPKLQEAKFDVWKPIRVNLDPQSLEGIPPGTNRYLLSSLVSLEEELRAERRRSPGELAKLDLSSYLQSRPRRKGWEGRPIVLLFDQFEEVLIVAPHDIQQKRDFFDALGKALENENIWALFILRDDYLGGFAPYRERIPTQMSMTFRIDLLGIEGAQEVAEESASKGGRAFPAAKKLVRDLATIHVQQLDGTVVSEMGQYVEPVQLQVVCRRLWEAMPEDDKSIDDEDVADYANVSTALADYYAQVVGKIAAGNAAVERTLREWVGQKLIVGGIRSQVRKEPNQSAGLDNKLIDQLLGSYLVRAEPRAGTMWFELSHDRLVKPVEESNKAWEQKILHPFQVQARLWQTAQRGAGLLLGVEALGEAEEWAEKNAALVTEDERAFLQQSRELRDREQEARTRLVRLAVAALLVAVVVAGLGVWAWVLRERALEAQNQAKKAQTDAEANESRAKVAEADAKRASLMAGAREFLVVGPPGAAALLLAEVDTPEKARGWFELATSALESGGVELTLPSVGPILSAAWSPDRQRVLAVSGNEVRVWRADGSDNPVVFGQDGDVTAAAWSPDGKRIGTAVFDTLRIWNVDRTGDPPVVLSTDGNFSGLFAWSPDGKRIVAMSGEDAAVANTDGTGKSRILKGHTARVTSVAWSPDGKHIVTASGDNTARVWTADELGGQPVVVLKGHKAYVSSVAWSPDGQRIATASDDNTVRIWHADGSGKPVVLAGHTAAVQSVAWSPDGKRIVTTSADRLAVVWHTQTHVPQTPLDCGASDPVVFASFSPDGKRIMTTCAEGMVNIANIDKRSGRVVKFKASWKGLRDAAWSPDGARILTTSGDGTVRVWNANGPEHPIRFGNGFYRDFGFSWSPDGTRFALGSDAGFSIAPVDGSGDSVQLSNRADFTGARWSPDGKRIVMLSEIDCFIGNADGSGTPVALMNDERPVGCARASWSSDSSRLVTDSFGTTPLLWHVVASDKPSILERKKGVDDRGQLVLSPDGKRLATTSRDGIVRVWNADDSGETIELKGHRLAPSNVAWSPDGKRIVTTSFDHTARVWNAETGESLYTFEQHTSPILSAVLSPDGQRIATTSQDRAVWVWNADGSGTPLSLRGHEATVQSVAWSPDGKRIVTASGDGTIRVWNADAPRDPWLIHASGPAAWSLDGERILTGGRDARSYLADMSRLREALRRATTDCLTVEQRQMYLLENESDARMRYEKCEVSHGRTLRKPASP